MAQGRGCSALARAIRGAASVVCQARAPIAIAWALSRGTDIVPLVGARRRDRLEEPLGVVAIQLTPSDLERIECAVPAGAAAGERYPAPLLATTDSERAITR